MLHVNLINNYYYHSTILKDLQLLTFCINSSALAGYATL